MKKETEMRNMCDAVMTGIVKSSSVSTQLIPTTPIHSTLSSACLRPHHIYAICARASPASLSANASSSHRHPARALTLSELQRSHLKCCNLVLAYAGDAMDPYVQSVRLFLYIVHLRVTNGDILRAAHTISGSSLRSFSLRQCLRRSLKVCTNR